jgi:hypothetical protein
MIGLKINVTRILKDRMHKGEKGTYLDLTLMENKDGPDQYGNDGFVVQDLGKEARERGEKGSILGNWRRLGKKQSAPKASQPAPTTPEPEDDDLPF